MFIFSQPPFATYKALPLKSKAKISNMLFRPDLLPTPENNARYAK